MKKTKISENSSSPKEKQLKGLKDNGQLTISCKNCHTDLLVLQLTRIENAKINDVNTSVAVKCCQCGVFSDPKNVNGQFYPGAPKDNVAFDVMEFDEDAPDVDVLFKTWVK